MRRPVIVLLAAAVFTGAGLAVPRATAASTTTSITTNVTVGASRTLPNGTFAYSDGCRVGYDGSTEYRCSFEFDISSIPSTASITTATLSIRKTAGCGTNDCPDDVYAYNGNGASDLSDVTGGSLVRITTPTSSVMNLDVASDLQARVSNGLAWIGYRMARDASSTRNPDWQDFDISGTDRVKLSVTYVAHPVDVQVYLAANEEGAGGGVTSTPAGISCGQTCLWTFEYAEPVTLTATPIDGALFAWWQGGPCDGSTDPVCGFDVPALNVVTTAVFTAIGTPVSAPPPTNPAGPTATPFLTPHPLPTAAPTGGPNHTGAPLPTGAGATGAIATAGSTAAPGETVAAQASGPAPTIVGIDDQGLGNAGASGGLGLPVVVLLIVVLGAAVGGGVYWYTKRRQAGS